MPPPSPIKPLHSSTAGVGVSEDWPQRQEWLWLGLITLVGFTVRLLASKGDLWLDEIMSVNIARAIRSPLDILLSAEAHKDNNHPLNTLWLWLMQSQDSFMLDRLHAVVAGTVSIPLAWAFARRWGRACGWCASVLVAGSFFMIHYGSEARGYSMLVMFTLLAMIAVDGALKRFTWPGAIAFWASCVLGMLSQLAFIHTFMALGAWFAWRMVSVRSEARQTLRITAIFFLPPALFIGWLYFAFIKGLKLAGAEVSPTLAIIAGAAADVVGTLEEQQTAAMVALILVALLLITATVLLIRRQDDSWFALLLLIIGAPAACMIILQPPFLLSRYFTVSITGTMLALSLLLGTLWQRGTSGRIAACGLIAAFLMVNSWNTSVLLRDGRGQYLEAMHDIARLSDSPAIRIGGDHDFRESIVINFYASYLRDQTVEYIPRKRIVEVRPQFLMCHSFDIVANPALPEIPLAKDLRYQLVKIYPSGTMSGWFWILYQRSGQG